MLCMNQYGVSFGYWQSLLADYYRDCYLSGVNKKARCRGVSTVFLLHVLNSDSIDFDHIH